MNISWFPYIRPNRHQDVHGLSWKSSATPEGLRHSAGSRIIPEYGFLGAWNCLASAATANEMSVRVHIAKFPQEYSLYSTAFRTYSRS